MRTARLGPGQDAVVVDVGIPTLGLTHYVLESVESVLAQTLSAWRLVISENGSGDERLLSALEPYLKDERITHIITGERLPRGKNYTRLIRAGAAPYVGLLHDDDRWGPEFLERRVDFLEKHTNCGFAFSNYAVIDDAGHVVAKSKLQIPEGVHRSTELFPELYRRMFIATPSVLVRRVAYEAIGSAYKEIVLTDHEMWLRLSAHFDAGFIAACDADYRFHAGQTSADSRIGDAQQVLLVLESVEDLAVPRRIRAAGLSQAHVWCALDFVETGAKREALRELCHALKVDKVAVLRPTTASRMLAAVAALATGERGRSALSGTRGRRWQSLRDSGVSFAADMEPVGSSTDRSEQ